MSVGHHVSNFTITGHVGNMQRIADPRTKPRGRKQDRGTDPQNQDAEERVAPPTAFPGRCRLIKGFNSRHRKGNWQLKFDVNDSASIVKLSVQLSFLRCLLVRFIR